MRLSLHSYSNLGFFLLRLVVGIIFLYHGHAKWGLWTAAPEGMDPDLLMKMKILAIVEPLGGIALILGVVTELAALGLAFIMVGAISTKISVMQVAFSGGTGTGWEFDLLLLGATVFLALAGGGTIALQPTDS